MLNHVVMVGRIVDEVETKELENGGKVMNITIAVQRSWKNAEGNYDTDFVPITLWNMIAEHTAEYCKKGDIIGIKGRIQTEEKNIQIIAEKITILNSKKESE